MIHLSSKPEAIAPFFCTDGQGKFLFYKRSQKSKDFHGYWDCSGGSMLLGEKPEAAVLRKLKNQYSCSGEILVKLPQTLVALTIDGVEHQWVAHPFMIKVNPGQVRIGDRKKMQEIGWFSLSKLPIPLHPGAEKIIQNNRRVFSLFS